MEACSGVLFELRKRELAPDSIITVDTLTQLKFNRGRARRIDFLGNRKSYILLSSCHWSETCLGRPARRRGSCCATGRRALETDSLWSSISNNMHATGQFMSLWTGSPPNNQGQGWFRERFRAAVGGDTMR